MEKAKSRLPARKLLRMGKRLVLLVAFLLGVAYLKYVTEFSSSSWYTARVIPNDGCSSACRSARGYKFSAKSDTEPFAYIVGSEFGTKTINPGDCVCVHAVVPPKTDGNAGTANSTLYRPIPGYPADSIMLDLVLRTTRDENGNEDALYKGSHVTVPVDLYAKSDDRDPTRAHVYQGTARLYDPGIYDVDARLDYRNGEWNAEPHQDSVPYSETRMKTTIPSNEFVLSQVHVKLDMKHPTYLKRHQNLPLCTRGDEAGRWIPEENLPSTWQKWQYMFPAEDGRVWLPYHCRMRRISHPEFTLYMSARYSSIHWYGDSNSRRTLRPFLSSGRWCHKKSQLSRIDCLCNDAPKDLFPDEWYSSMPVPHWYRIHSDGVRSSEIYSDLRNLPVDPTDERPIVEKDPIREDYLPDYVPPGYSLRNDYFDLYYLFTRGTLDMQGSFWDRDITRRNISQYREASLVVVQIVTWDAAFGNWTWFTKQVVRMADRLKSVYPRARFIYRSGPFWCCRMSDDPEKKYDRLRFQAFDRLARKTFVKRLSAQVWDVTESHRCRSPEMKRYSENMPCKSAHSRAEVIHLDNQILMNMLVNG